MANDPAGSVSPKVGWSVVAQAITTAVWVVIAHLWLKGWSQSDVATLTATTVTVVTFVIGYMVPDPARKPS